MIWREVEITDAMRARAAIEAGRREAFIRRRFVLDGGNAEADVASFIGEFCLKELVGQDWRSTRESYERPDDFDVIVAGKKIDVKTSLRVRLRDVLFNAGQAQDLIEKYDIVVFGAMTDHGTWLPLGWLEAARVPSYPVAEGPRMKSPAHQIPHGDLRRIPLPETASSPASAAAAIRRADQLVDTLSQIERGAK